MMSAMTITTTTGQNTTALGVLLLCIFLALFALDAVPRVRERVEPLEGDVLAAVVTLAERLRRPVEPAQRFVDVPEESAFLAGEQERLLALHGVRALVGHVERVRAQVTIRGLRRRAERLVVVSELIQHATTLLEQPFLEMLKILLVHRLDLLGAAGGWHRYGSLVRATRTGDPSRSATCGTACCPTGGSPTAISRANSSLAIQSLYSEIADSISSGATIHSRIRSLTSNFRSLRSRWSWLTSSRAIPSRLNVGVIVGSIAAKRPSSSFTVKSPVARRTITKSSASSMRDSLPTATASGVPCSKARRSSLVNAATACAASGVLFPNFLPSDLKFGFASSVTSASAELASVMRLTFSSASSRSNS